MNTSKQLLLTGYYWATIPVRRSAAVRRYHQYAEPIRILFYHRVADEHPNDWTMSTATFAAQILWLGARFELISLAEAQARITAGRNRRPAVCITFDDGYADKMRFAVPLLVEHGVPFTYFVSTEHVLSGRPFPHDVANGCPLAPNSVDDLRELAAMHVEIGGHTRSHADLGKLPPARLFDEIVGCKSDLEDVLQRNVRFFAFPYGLHQNLSRDAFLVARKAGFEAVCSAYGGYNFPGDDAFHLRRFHADSEFIRFKNWLTIDPRKFRRQGDFDPCAS
jgi:peptidoglycan/xylan/chitin deacetylase (PgdA/CDA1 family)